jgi:SAM-dependent methyltransferase
MHVPEPPNNNNDEMLARYRRRQSRLYRMLRPPLPLIYNPRERHLPGCDGVKLFIGGAAGTIPLGFLNVDAQEYPGVDIVADVQALPFADNSTAAIECDAVLEHVRNPTAAVVEMMRVLRPGGFLHVVVPFCQPFHAYPSDYQRWTMRGLRELLPESQCNVLDEGIRTGPTATLLSAVCEYCRIVAPASLGRVAYAAANWLLWPLRYLDLWLNRKPNASILANAIYILVEKKPT